MPTTSHIRILLIDDHELVRTGLRMLLECHPHMTVVGEASSGAEGLAGATGTQPDIILLDLNLDGESGLDLLPKLLASASRTRVIVVTGVRAPEEYYRAVHLGAMGLVRKDQAADVLIQAIERVHAGEVWLEPSMVARAIADMSGQRAVGH